MPNKANFFYFYKIRQSICFSRGLKIRKRLNNQEVMSSLIIQAKCLKLRPANNCVGRRKFSFLIFDLREDRPSKKGESNTIGSLLIKLVPLPKSKLLSQKPTKGKNIARHLKRTKGYLLLLLILKPPST